MSRQASLSGLALALDQQPARRRERLLTVAQVAEWLNMSEGWIRDHATGRRRPALPCIKLGKSLRFSESRVDQWLQQIQEGQ